MIQCVCLNPVLQRTLTLERFTVNTVNRVIGKPLEGSAGKGINTARALKTLNQRAVITGFCGGDTGALIEQTLSQEDLAYEFVRTANKTRICTTILDPVHQTQTEIVEEGLPVAPSEVAAMIELYRKYLDHCTLVTIAGTTPAQVPQTIYRDFVALATDRNILTLVDTQKGLLRECLTAHPFLVKVNREELAVAFGECLDHDEKLVDVLRRMGQTGVPWVVVTNGKAPTIVAHEADIWDILPPVVQAVNPIGAGDVTLAGIAAAIARGDDVLAAIQFGTACGSASTLTLTPGHIRIADVERLAAETRVIRKL